MKDADWTQGNPLILLVDSVSTDLGERETESANENAGRSPKLTIKYQGYLSGGTTQKTVRQYLLEVVDQLDHKSGTPFVDTYYEAAKYFEGDPVYYGLSRGGGPTLSASEISGASSNSGELKDSERTRLSHPESYEGDATIDRSADVDGDGIAGCSLLNPTSVDCRTERITSTPSNYISPIADACQANYIIMLSDGQANNNHSSGLIPSDKTLTGACNATITQTSDGTGRSASSGEACGVDLAKYLYNPDDDANGADNSIFTHTIGLSLSGDAAAVDFLKEIAEQGNGQFFNADDQSSIDVAFDTIIKDAIQSNSSFVTPGLSVNAFNRLFSRNFVYFNLFHTDSDATWDGNLKKFALCDNEDPTVCTFGEVIDSNGDQAVDTDPSSADFGNLKDTAVGFWSTAGTSEITDQGAGSRVLDYTDRMVYAAESQAGTSLRTPFDRFVGQRLQSPVQPQFRLLQLVSYRQRCHLGWQPQEVCLV